MFLRLAATAACVAVCASAWPGRAATPVPTIADTTGDAAAPSAPAAIRDAIRDAWQRHPGQRAADAQLAAARARYDAAAQPLYNPTLDLAHDDEAGEITSTVGASLTLDLGGKRGARRDAAQARVDRSVADAHLGRREFARRWLIAWSSLRGAGARVEIGERRVALTRRFAELAEQQFAAGDISGAERDLARLAHDEAQVQQAALLAERAQADAEARALSGDADALAALPLPSDGLAGARTDAAVIETPPEAQAADADARIAAREVTLARRDRVPDPTVGFRVGRIRVGGASDRVFGVSLSVPLFVRNAYRAEVVAASAQADAAHAERRRVEIELAAERQRAIDTYAAAAAAWKQWRGSRATDVERRSQLLERIWREGELSTSDYLLQLRQTLETALAGAELETRLWRAYTDFLVATGRVERWAGLETTP